MTRSSRGTARAILLALTALTVSACASNGDSDQMRAQLEQAVRDAKSAQQAAGEAQAAAEAAKRAASEASVAADAAMSAANQANNCCAANTERIERAFRKSQAK